MSPYHLSRRAILGTVGTAAVSGLAGCGAVPWDGGERLRRIRLENNDDQPHTVHVLVEYEGEPVHWSATDVAAVETSGAYAELEGTWPDDAGRFVLRVRVDDRSSWRSHDSSSLDTTCYAVKVDVTDWDDDDEPYVEIIPEPRDCDSFE